MVWYKRQLFDAVLVGVLLGVGFVNLILWWLALVGAGYYLWLLQNEKIAISGSLIAWIIKYLFALVWFWSAYPLDWLGVSLGWWTVVVIFFYWFSAALWLGSGGVLFHVIFKAIKKYNRVVGVWAAPFVWLAAELAGALVFSIMSYGQGGSIGTQFSFGFVGYHVAQHPIFFQTANIAGVYGLTCLFVLLAIFIYRWYIRSQWVYIAMGCIVVVASSFVSIGDQPTVSQSDTTISIAVVDTTTPFTYMQSEEGIAKKQQQMAAAYTAAKEQSVDYILFPEDSRLFTAQSTTSLREYLAFATTKTDPVIIDSARVQSGTGAVLEAHMFDPATAELTTAHKRYLVPQGEFMPYLYSGVLRISGLGEAANKLEQRLTYMIGPQETQTHLASDLPGILFCFESVDPRGVQKVKSEHQSDVPFVAHIVSHAWFNEPYTLWPQLEVMLRIQAKWNDTYIVSAANHAVGYAVTPTGQVVYPTPAAAGETWKVGVIDL